MRKSILIMIGTILFFTGFITAEETADIRPVNLLQPMPDFTLPSFQGGNVQLSDYRGTNVLLIFPRGLAGKDHWCHICQYQYAELVEINKKFQIEDEYDLKIIFVLPYSSEMVKEWVAAFPAQLADIEKWKNPPDPEKLDPKGKKRLQFIRSTFPMKIIYSEDNIPTPFPILIDADRSLSSGLGLFTEEWGGSRIEQNIPTLFFLNKEGIVKFKYHSQNTFDRPDFKYLRRIITCFE